MPRKKSETPREPGKNIKINLALHKLLKTVSILSGQEMGVIIDKVMHSWLLSERTRLLELENQ